MITSGTVEQHVKVHAWTLQVTLPVRAWFVTFFDRHTYVPKDLSADVLECSLTLRPLKFNNGARLLYNINTWMKKKKKL